MARKRRKVTINRKTGNWKVRGDISFNRNVHSKRARDYVDQLLDEGWHVDYSYADGDDFIWSLSN